MNKTTLIISLVIVAIIAAVIMALNNNTDKSQKIMVNTESPLINKDDSDVESQENTIAEKWQWSEEQKNRIPQSQDNGFPFTKKSVHDALYAVKVCLLYTSPSPRD